MCWKMRPNSTQPIDGPNPCPSLVQVYTQVLPGVAELRVAGAVEEEVESEVGGLQEVGGDERQLELGRVVVTHRVVAETPANGYHL